MFHNNKATTQQDVAQCSKADIVNMHEIENKVNEHFFNLFSKKVIAEKEAYLSTELLIDIQEMSFDAGLDEPTIKQTSNLRNKLEHFFDGKIGFEKVDKKLIVYPIDIYPCLGSCFFECTKLPFWSVLSFSLIISSSDMLKTKA